MAEREYRRINCGIFLNPEERKYVDGKIEFHPEFLNRYYDWKGWFEDEFEQLLAAKFGEDGWAIYFTQVTQDEPNFFVDIYLDAINHDLNYMEFANFATGHLVSKGFKAMPFLRGTLSDYLKNQ